MNPRLNLPIAGFSLLVVLAGCQGPPPAPTGAARADLAAAAYCRQRAEEVYNVQNRGARYQSDNRDTPFSASYVPSVTSRGLSDRYALDAMVSECVRNSAASRDAGPEPATPNPAGPNPPGPNPPGPATPARR